MKISIKHHKKTKLQKRSIQAVDVIVAKAARTLVQIIRDSHRLGFNINDEYMSDLGEEGLGYSKQYKRYKMKYNPSSYSNGAVNLDYSGRFHKGLRIRKARVKGESGYYIHSVNPPMPLYPGTSMIYDNYKDIFANYEDFTLSKRHSKTITDILKETKKTILQSILYGK